MQRFAGLLLCTCLLFTTLLAFGAGTDAIPLGMRDYSRSDAHLSITRVSPELTSIILESPEVMVHDQLVDYQSYRSFAIAGEYTTMQTGSPTVPQVTRFYRIPNTGGADLVITNAEYDVIDNVNPFPVQPDQPGFGGLTRDDAVYAADAWYPANVAEMSAPMIMRDFRVVTVTLYPVQVNPVTHQARIYRNLSVDVVANNQPGQNELTNPHQPSGEWASVYRNYIPNLEDNALDGMTNTPGTFMIVTSTNAAIRPFADSLAEWKTRKGFKVVIDARSDVSNATTIRNDIINAYQNSNPPLEYVCLMGEPGWTNIGVATNGSSSTGHFDHDYASLTSGDELEDIGVGRLSGGNGNAMATINAKIMMYERNPHMQTSGGAADTMWFHKSFLYAGVARSCAGNYLIMRWAKDQFMHNTGVYLDSVKTHPNDNIVTSDVTSQINGGISFFLWRGSWVGGMGNNIADGTTPNGRLPITMTITCSAGEFAGQGISGPAEDFLCAGTSANPAGGVCGMGTSTIGTENGANGILATGIIYAIADMQVEHIGTAIASTKAQLYSAYGPNLNDTDPYGPGGPIALNFTRYFNLLGDPSLAIWTDVPDSLTVSHPTTLNIGARSVDVTVVRHSDNAPVQDALVVLWKKGPDSTWVKGLTDASGHITLPVSVNTAGTMYLTVTKRNHKPYLYDIPCSQADCQPMFSSVILDDDNNGGTQGNGDHILNPGETIDLPVYIKNFGNTTSATGVSANIVSTNPNVTVVTGHAVFPDIAAGDSVLSATPFRIRVDHGMQNREQVLLAITVTSSAGQSVGTIPLTCSAGEAVYVRSRISTAAFNPGTTTDLTVVLRNLSTAPMTSVSGHLVPLNPFVQATVSDASFGDISGGALDSNSAAFTITASSMAFRGLQAPMRLILTTLDGFADTTQFTLSIGRADSTDPAGPDAYGYYAYDNLDTSYDNAPVYSYVDISANGGTNLNISDTGEKTAPTPVWAAVRTLPFGFKFYGQVYNQITVCSNGWCAFGDQSYMDLFRHYQIPMMDAPDAMIAPYFTDLATSGSGRGVWVKSDSANHRYIIQWKANAWGGSCNGSGSYNSPLDFEVLLYDTTYEPTMDGNGKVIVQYNQVTMNLNSQYCDEPPGCTVGIQKPGNLVGLQYAYQNTYAPGAATIRSGRAILYTTEAHQMFGHIRGTVLNAAGNQPLAGVDVGVTGYDYHAVTDASGNYLIPNVLIGTYGLHASLHRFNTDSVSSIVVALNDTVTVNFSLRHPEIALSVDSLADSIGDSSGQQTFNIVNNGNGLLDYNIQVFYAGSHSPNPWDSVGDVNATQECGNAELWGCEFVGDSWWVSGSGSGGQNMLYRFNDQGNLVGSIPQPNSLAFGWFDMAYDGQYLYGTGNHAIIGIDTSGQVHDSIPAPVNPARAIAYDSVSGHFWVADYTSDIYEIDRQGTVVHQIPNTQGLIITGLAWNSADASGKKLYIFSSDGTTARARVTRALTASPFTMETLVDLATLPGDMAGGCAVTPAWNSSLLVFGALLRGSIGPDHLEIYQLSFNSTWVNPTPAQSSIPGGSNGEITVHYNPATLRDGSYRVDLHVTSTICDTTLVLPVHLTVNRVGVSTKDRISKLPERYALHQNFPNPFNPTTTIRYELKAAGLTRLTVYNLLGEKVADLVNAKQPAGFYEVPFDASALPSGMYFYRLTSGSFTQSAKMMLLK